MMVVVRVVESMEHDRFALAVIQVLTVVIDHEVGVNDALVAAENDVAPADKGEMLLQPLVLFGQRERKLHGCRHNVYFEMLHQGPDAGYGIGHDRDSAEEAGCLHKAPD